MVNQLAVIVLRANNRLRQLFKVRVRNSRGDGLLLIVV